METKNRTTNVIKQADYKDVDMLKKFLSVHARVLSKKKSNTSSRNQRKIAQAIKRARFMALLPYVTK